MSVLGDLIAFLKLDTRDVSAHAASAKRDLASVGPAAAASMGQATRAAKELDTQGAKTALTLREMGKGVAAGFGLGAGLGAAQLAIQGAREVAGVLQGMTERALADEESQNRLAASLRANVPAWDGQTAAIERRILAGQRLGFVDEDMRNSLTLLLGATHDVAKAQAIQATAMDLARFKGVDLRTASEALIKVEAGVYRSLKSLGIVLKDGATQTEALAAVQAVAGGQAEAYAKTNAGKLTASQVAVDEAMERLGSKTMPVVVEVLRNAAEVAIELADAAGGVVGAIDDIGKAAERNKGPVGSFMDLLSTARGDKLPTGLLPTGLNEDFKALQAAKEAANEVAAAMNEAAHLQQVQPVNPGHLSAVGALLQDLKAQVAAGSATIDQAAQQIVDRFGTDLQALQEIGSSAGTDLTLAIAKGIALKEDAPLEALKGLHTRLNSEASKERQEAFLLAALTGVDIANGLKSSDPAVYEAAVASRKVITDQLDVLTNGAYSAGSNAGANWTKGFRKAMAGDTPGAGDIITIPKVNDWTGGLSKLQLSSGQKDYLAWLKGLDPAAKSAAASLGTLAADAKAKMTQAFDEMKTAAKSFFDELHAHNQKAIDDSKALRDAQIQGPVDAMRASLEAERSKRQEAELRAALAAAKTPADQATAQQALTDFLQDEQLNAAQTAADAAKKISDQQAADQTTAENKRYDAQVKSFEKELGQLQSELARHPEEWRKAQRDVLVLLAKYGVDFKAAGLALGTHFVAGLRSSIKDAEAAAKALAGAGTPKTGSPAPTGSGYASGSPAYNPGTTGKGALGALGSLGPGSGSAGGGGTFIVQVDGQEWLRIMDERLAVRESLVTVRAPGRFGG